MHATQREHPITTSYTVSLTDPRWCPSAPLPTRPTYEFRVFVEGKTYVVVVVCVMSVLLAAYVCCADRSGHAEAAVGETVKPAR